MAARWMDQAKRSIISVGEGRGFVVQSRGREHRLVITAAHCLPHIPPAHTFSYNEERIYRGLLAAFTKQPTAAAECRFVDPISGVAVLGQPENREFSSEADAYDDLVETLARPFPISDISNTASGWVLSLDGDWFECTANHRGGPLWVDGPIVGGMSGSPIVGPDGAAIGIIATGGGGTEGKGHRPQPRLSQALPGWLLAGLPRRRARV